MELASERTNATALVLPSTAPLATFHSARTGGSTIRILIPAIALAQDIPERIAPHRYATIHLVQTEVSALIPTFATAPTLVTKAPTVQHYTVRMAVFMHRIPTVATAPTLAFADLSALHNTAQMESTLPILTRVTAPVPDTLALTVINPLATHHALMANHVSE